MADQVASIPEGQLFRDAEGNLHVFRDGEFSGTDELAVQTGPVEAAFVAGGETLSNVAGNVGRALGFDEAALADAGLAVEPELTQSLRAERPISTGVGDAAPFLGAAAATAAAGVPAMIAAETALGGFAGGNAAQPFSPSGAAIGAASVAAPAGVGKVAAGMLRARAARRGGQQTIAADVADLTPTARPDKATRQARAFDEQPRAPAGRSAGAAETSLHARRVGQADQLGYTLTTGERVNSDTMRQIEAGFRSSPAGPPRGREIVRANQENLNALWGDAMGAGKVTKITPEVMGRARDNATEEFTKAADIAGTVDVRSVPRRVAENREARGTSLIQDEQVQDALASLTKFENVPGGMAARDFMATRSHLNTQMRSAATRGDGLLKETYGDVINAMDETFEASAGPEAAALYNAAREHSRFIITLERGKGVNLDKGNVNPVTAGASLRKTFKQEAGRGDPGDLSDAGVDAIEGTTVANYFSDIVGDSGTATRQFVNELVRNPVQMATLGTTTRLAGEAFDRVVSPVREAFGNAGASQGARPGPFPLDIGGTSVPGGPLDL